MRRKLLLPLLGALALTGLCACGQQGEPVLAESELPSATGVEEAPVWGELAQTGKLELEYADQFSVDYYEGDYALVSIADGSTYLVNPEGAQVPQGLPEGTVVLQQPLDSIYLVATSAMDLFRQLDGIGNITLSGLNAEGWYIEEAKAAMEAGEMVYAGKYNAPDYETILALGCDLAIESTMIYHNPEVKEQLEGFQIPVLVERSSYESHPLGRVEWLKLYGVLLDKEEEAQSYFDAQMEKLSTVIQGEGTGKTVAFFYITSNGAANVRKSGDYVARAIELAGGSYIFSDLEEDGNALSTMNMQMESFYEGARDADYLIYNSAIDGELETIDQLLSKSELLKDFKAVQEGHVWCTGKNLFQESLGLSDLIVDVHTILTDPETGDENLTYLHRLDEG